MSDLLLADHERQSFYQDITLNRCLGYFYNFDDVPLSFVYRDELIEGELTELEQRNRTLTETLWLGVYNKYCACDVGLRFFYQGSSVQFPLQVFRTDFGKGPFFPDPPNGNLAYASTGEVKASFDAFMEETGWAYLDEARHKPPVGSWKNMMGTPDRTLRIVSQVPCGNHTVLECISTYSRDGLIKESALATVLTYDVDGTILLDRDYLELANWHSANTAAKSLPKADSIKIPAADVMQEFVEYQKSLQTEEIKLSDLERQNLSVVEEAWVESLNSGLDETYFHADRFRMQWPHQKCSFNFEIAKEIVDIEKEAAPGRKMELLMTYAKGNQVIAEGVLSWTEDGIQRDAPFISFLLLDKDGLIIRERRYHTLSNWPGAEEVARRLGL